MDAFKDSIYHTFYATNYPQQTRTRPMQVIAVGISRSATESLQQALHMLGIEHVWHGYDSIVPPFCLEAQYKLAVKKYRSPMSGESLNTGLKISRDDFDAVFGHCVGVSDLPAAAFARELIAAYPEAKIILNTRSDMAAWHKSFDATIGRLDKDTKDWEWCKSWFCAELFWVRQCMNRTQMPGFFAGSFACNGVWVYQEHVAMIRGLGLPRERLLEWQAADGWAPLCEFLGKPVPSDVAFPNGNPTTEFQRRVGVIMQEYNRRALRNMAISGAVLFFSVAWLAYSIIL